MSPTLAALRAIEERQRAHRQDEAMPEAQWLAEQQELLTEWRRR